MSLYLLSRVIDWLYLYVHGLCTYNLSLKTIVIDRRNLDCVTDIISNMS